MATIKAHWSPSLQARPQPPAAWRCSWRQFAEMYLSSQQTQHTTSATPSARSSPSTPHSWRASPTSMPWCVLHTSQSQSHAKGRHLPLLRSQASCVDTCLCQGLKLSCLECMAASGILPCSMAVLLSSWQHACPPACFSVPRYVLSQSEGAGEQHAD